MGENKSINTDATPESDISENTRQSKEETAASDQNSETDDYEKTCLNYISSLKTDIEQFMSSHGQVSKNDKKEHDLCTEYLLQSLLKLDSVESNNSDRIREARKSVVLYVQQWIHYLDVKSKSTQLV